MYDDLISILLQSCLSKIVIDLLYVVRGTENYIRHGYLIVFLINYIGVEINYLNFLFAYMIKPHLANVLLITRGSVGI